jgi:Domain of unknown function (DUF4424)
MNQLTSGRVALVLCVAAALLAGAAAGRSAVANDSTATLGAGGIVLTPTKDIALDSEDLYISPTEIRVRYRFRNLANLNLPLRIAFPLPDIDLAELSEVPVEHPGSDGINFVDFKVAVDGHAIAPELAARALLKDEDVTDYLLSKNVKLSFFVDGFRDSLLALDAASRRDMTARGLAVYDEYDNVYPQWRLRTAFHWPQMFSANATVVIEHSYKPVVGQFFVSKYSLEGGELARFCVDRGTAVAIDKRIKGRSTTADNEGLLIARNVEYILKTARNWRGPIGRFTLTLDKGGTDRILSLCFDGVMKKTGPTTFTAEFTNYVPNADLSLLILE